MIACYESAQGLPNSPVDFRTFLRGVKGAFLAQINVTLAKCEEYYKSDTKSIQDALTAWQKSVDDQFNTFVERALSHLASVDGGRHDAFLRASYSKTTHPDCKKLKGLENDRRIHTFYFTKPTLDKMQEFWDAFDDNGDGQLDEDDFSGARALALAFLPLSHCD